MNRIRLIIDKLRKVDRASWRTWGLAFLVMGMAALVWDLSTPVKKAEIVEIESPETAATFIPAGYVLVPIEVENYESLDSILGKHGVVDLYKASDLPNGRPRKVATRVKILRAPLNPSHFAVLAPETQSQTLVAYSGAYTVVVQNPEQSGTEFVEPGLASGHTSSRVPHKKRSRIVVEVNDEN